jgi:hypothetical protein
MTTRVAGVTDQVREILAQPRDRAELVALLAGLASMQAECLAAVVADRPDCRVVAARFTAAAAGQATGAVLRGRCLTMAVAAKLYFPDDPKAECTLREAGRRGQLPLVHVGRYVYIRQESLERWIAARESKG